MNAEPAPPDHGPQAMAAAQRAIGELYATITQLGLDASDAADGEYLIAQLESAIDAKLAAYEGNPIIDALRAKAKIAFRQAVLEKLGLA
ncbi:MAG TPA: hypothetical protein VGV17_24735 [Bosea sp. (in: a-proteobacteria)]|uniref:hypothetical protein n=1 Tax=Bosea sp. (in: a-proteobacteria) TaxID=1871050 RepID=UPI002DDCB83C|nr:hypothetical protein [Bosea sp. (in: a-proteobacteria)]HEV2556968.1 hypothetical protein [Bosea sp. (in: a-proteobacteria)]